MARGSIGRERILSGVVGNNNISHQQPNAIQEDLNNELLAVSVTLLHEFERAKEKSDEAIAIRWFFMNFVRHAHLSFCIFSI
jgi:hypothetical protein